MTKGKSVLTLITAFTSVILEAALLQAGGLPEPRVPDDGEALQRLKVDPGGRFLVRNDGTPFFWLGDTA
ncbi:hypothetical protein ACFL6S_34585, partial [Candidatus Poribacteria bacterium]